jgi:glycosyltransferase involved in cell wall biosynthesis
MEKTESELQAVSIALCTYNGERFLNEQLESIFNQDYKKINEIICIDDNSNDNTWEILKEYANKYDILKIYQNHSNLGFVKNFEKALTLTSNFLIAISDQDDIWYSSKISNLVNSIGNNIMSYSDNDYIDINGESLGKKFSDKRNLTTNTSCLNFALFNAISGHTILLNRNLLHYSLPFPKEIPYDFWLAFKASQYGEIQVVKKALVGYRQHDNNTIGAIGAKTTRKKDCKSKNTNKTLNRIQIFAKNVAPNLVKEQCILQQLGDSYTDRSIKNRLKRVAILWNNRGTILLFKKTNNFRKMFFCFKAFWKFE